MSILQTFCQTTIIFAIKIFSEQVILILKKFSRIALISYRTNSSPNPLPIKHNHNLTARSANNTHRLASSSGPSCKTHRRVVVACRSRIKVVDARRTRDSLEKCASPRSFEFKRRYNQTCYFDKLPMHRLDFFGNELHDAKLRL